jgi:poly-gamma-glutamate synthesis protein (capsule biosynthesis protein)
MWLFLSSSVIHFSFFYFKSEGVKVVIVYMHWGREFGLHPDRKRLLMTKYLYSLGVTAVIGAHSHILQSHSLTNEHFAAYSLGNFLFPLLSACLTVRVKFQFYRFVLKQASTS